MRFLDFIHRQIRVWSGRADEGFVREASAEAEACDEAVEAVGVEKVGGDGEVLFEGFSLLLGERFVQFGLKVALFLHKRLDLAVRTYGALAG